ncbi:MAG TPA: fused response regulator/phosphatase [Vicinamibacterales bacterium]|nr:fused response regulator/phosphatase [Vicinamibacterales bacterium]
MSARAEHIPRTLIADDQPDVVVALRLLLKTAGYQTEAATSPTAVLEAIKRNRFDVVLIDLNYARDTTSGQEGLDLITRIQAEDRSLPIVVMTAWGTVDLAVEAMRRGVRDFVQKPWENSRLLQVLRAQVEQGRVRRRLQRQALRRRANQRNLEQELREARQIQRQLMSAADLELEDFVFSSAWRVAGKIGGDYLAAFPVSAERAALCIADVSGKGLPAALMMSNMQAALKSAASADVMPGDLCLQLNRLLHSNSPLNRFITCFYGLVDVRHRVLQFTNAGHNPPLLVRRNGELLDLVTGGRVLGAFADTTYSEDEIELHSGDRLLLFTDGVTEVRNAFGEEFGEGRLAEVFARERRRSAADLQQTIMKCVSEFCDDQFEDDAALMVVEVK